MANIAIFQTLLILHVLPNSNYHGFQRRRGAIDPLRHRIRTTLLLRNHLQQIRHRRLNLTILLIANPIPAPHPNNPNLLPPNAKIPALARPRREDTLAAHPPNSALPLRLRQDGPPERNTDSRSRPRPGGSKCLADGVRFQGSR